MDSIDEQIAIKRKELQSLQKITSLTDGLKIQLIELNEQIKEMGMNADSVAQLMNNWDSIINNISQASLGLLQYAEGDYEIGPWKDSKKNESEQSNETGLEAQEMIRMMKIMMRMKIWYPCRKQWSELG